MGVGDEAWQVGEGAGVPAAAREALRAFGEGRDDALRDRLVDLAARTGETPGAEAEALAAAATAAWSFATGRFARLEAIAAERALAEPIAGAVVELLRLALLRLQGRGEDALPAAVALRERGAALGVPILAAFTDLEWARLAGARGSLEAARVAAAASAETLRAEGLPRGEALALRVQGELAWRDGDPAAARAALRAAVAVADTASDRPMAGAARAELAACELLAHEREAAGVLARRALHDLEDALRGGLPFAAPVTALALWVVACTGDAPQAQARAAAAATHLRAPLLPLTDHVLRLLLSDVARRAGEHERARALAVEAWSLAARHGLDELDPWLTEAAAASAEDAIRAGVAKDTVAARLATIAPAALAAVVAGLLADPDEGLRLRALGLAERLQRPDLQGALRAATADASPEVARRARRALAIAEGGPAEALGIRSLGGLEVSRDGAPVPRAAWRGEMARRLLCRLLVAEGRPVPREALMADLWPAAPEGAARANLRVALSRLQGAIDPGRPAGAAGWFVRAEGNALWLDLERVAEWDVLRFERALRAGAAAERAGDLADAAARYGEAVACYDGPLLPEVRGEEWALALGARLAHAFQEVGLRCGELLLAAGRTGEAGAVAARLLREDPADEEAVALRMQAQLARGEHARARRTFETARRDLRRLLDVEPGEALCALAERARRSPTR